MPTKKEEHLHKAQKFIIANKKSKQAKKHTTSTRGNRDTRHFHPKIHSFFQGKNLWSKCIAANLMVAFQQWESSEEALSFAPRCPVSAPPKIVSGKNRYKKKEEVLVASGAILVDLVKAFLIKYYRKLCLPDSVCVWGGLGAEFLEGEAFTLNFNVQKYWQGILCDNHHKSLNPHWVKISNQII